MPIDITARFSFALSEPTDVLLQFEAAALPEQVILASNCRIDPVANVTRVPAQAAVGERMWLRANGLVEIDYTAEVAVERMVADIGSLDRLEPHNLPGETIEYLFDSRYCPADRFHPFIESEFAGCTGGARIVAIRDWIAGNFSYEPGSSTSVTTALDSFVERRGICRDYAHVLITLARASGIPARYVSAFAPGVDPPDFHALAEVFLADPTVPGGGAWYLADATGMADPAHTAKIGVGRDAADVSFMTVFGFADFRDKMVAVTFRE